MYSQINVFEGKCVKIYDPEKKQLIAVYRNIRKANQKLNISATRLRQKAISKRRIFCEKLNMQIAVRLSDIGKEEELLIEKTLANTLLT